MNEINKFSRTLTTQFPTQYMIRLGNLVSWECHGTFRHISVIKSLDLSGQVSATDFHLEMGVSIVGIVSIVHAVLYETTVTVNFLSKFKFAASAEIIERMSGLLETATDLTMSLYQLLKLTLHSVIE